MRSHAGNPLEAPMEAPLTPLDFARRTRRLHGSREAAIVGLPHEKWGEAPHAFVVLREDTSATEAELIAFTRDRLAHFKAPHSVTFVAELPKTATGKIQKYVLRDDAPNLTRQ